MCKGSKLSSIDNLKAVKKCQTSKKLSTLVFDKLLNFDNKTCQDSKSSS